MSDAQCKICRRMGVKLFLKGERCLSPKCAFLKKSYSPGRKGKRRTSPLSEYGKELKEKQKLKNWYNLGERQFRKYVKEILKRRGKVADTAALLIETLEKRFDNAIYRLGFTNSRSQARQLVSHGHFLVNGRRVSIPSYQLKKGEKISVNPSSKKKKVFENLIPLLKKHQTPSWLKLDAQNMEGEVVGTPTVKEATPPAEISTIFEFYSR